VLFDGDCIFCNKWAIYILKNDRSKSIYVCSSDSGKGKELISFYNVKTDIEKSIILIMNKKYYSHSTAVIKIALHMKGVYLFLFLGYLIPKFLRDYIYNLIAKRRRGIIDNICDLNNFKNHSRFIH